MSGIVGSYHFTRGWVIIGYLFDSAGRFRWPVDDGVQAQTFLFDGNRLLRASDMRYAGCTGSVHKSAFVRRMDSGENKRQLSYRCSKAFSKNARNLK